MQCGVHVVRRAVCRAVCTAMWMRRRDFQYAVCSVCVCVCVCVVLRHLCVGEIPNEYIHHGLLVPVMSPFEHHLMSLFVSSSFASFVVTTHTHTHTRNTHIHNSTRATHYILARRAFVVGAHRGEDGGGYHHAHTHQFPPPRILNPRPRPLPYRRPETPTTHKRTSHLLASSTLAHAHCPTPTPPPPNPQSFSLISFSRPSSRFPTPPSPPSHPVPPSAR
jgi:hypothetical protein